MYQYHNRGKFSTESSLLRDISHIMLKSLNNIFSMNSEQYA